MTSTIEKLKKFPILFYEDTPEGEPVNPIPYIEIEGDDKMPVVLFVQEYKHTDEVEPDSEGNPQPIVDMYMHKFVDMELLKEKLSPELNDVVRDALGMKPLLQAQEAGKKILDRVFENVNTNPEESN